MNFSAVFMIKLCQIILTFLSMKIIFHFEKEAYTICCKINIHKE